MYLIDYFHGVYHQYVYSPYCSPYISKEADKEDLFINEEQQLLLVIIISILMTFMFDSGVIL